MQEVLNLSRKMLLESEYIQLTKEFINFGFRPQGLDPRWSSIVIQLESYASDGTRYGAGGGGGSGSGGMLCNSPSDFIQTEDDPPKTIRISSPSSKANDGFFVQFNCMNSELDRALELSNMVTLSIVRSTMEGVTFTIQDKGILYDVDGFNCYISVKVNVDMSVIYDNDYTDNTQYPIPHSIAWNLTNPAWYPGVYSYDLAYLRDINGNELNPSDYNISVPQYYHQIEPNGKVGALPANFFVDILEDGQLQLNTNEVSTDGLHESMDFPFRYVFDVDVWHDTHPEAYARITTQVFLDWDVWDYPPISDCSMIQDNPEPASEYIAGQMNDIKISPLLASGSSGASIKLNTETGEYFQFLVIESQDVVIQIQNAETGYWENNSGIQLTITDSPEPTGFYYASQNYWYGTLDLSGFTTEDFTNGKFRVLYDAKYIDENGDVIMTKKFINLRAVE